MKKSKINKYINIEASEETESESEETTTLTDFKPVRYDDIARKIEEKYLQYDDEDESEEDEDEEGSLEERFVSQASFLPKKSSPRLFLVKVKYGKEKEIALKILNNVSGGSSSVYDIDGNMEGGVNSIGSSNTKSSIDGLNNSAYNNTNAPGASSTTPNQLHSQIHSNTLNQSHSNTQSHSQPPSNQQLPQQQTICSVIVKDGLKGYIYIESFQKQHLLDSFSKIRGINKQKISIVPQNEMIEALTYKQNFEHVEFARIKKGKYKNDLVQIIENLDEMVRIRVMPRINGIKKLFDVSEYKDEVVCGGSRYGRYGRMNRDGGRRNRMIDGEESDSIDNNNNTLYNNNNTLYNNNNTLYNNNNKLNIKDNEVYIYKNETYVNGYLIKDVLRSSLNFDVEPNFEELEQFNVKKVFDIGDKIRVVKGELTGLCGVVSGFTNGIATIKVVSSGGAYKGSVLNKGEVKEGNTIQRDSMNTSTETNLYSNFNINSTLNNTSSTLNSLSATNNASSTLNINASNTITNTSNTTTNTTPNTNTTTTNHYEVPSNSLERYFDIGEEVKYGSENGIITNIKNNIYYVAIKNFTEEISVPIDNLSKPTPVSKDIITKERTRPVLKRDRLINKQVQIKKGKYKGYVGIVKDVYMNKCRVQINSNLKCVSIFKEDLDECDFRNEFNKSESYIGTFNKGDSYTGTFNKSDSYIGTSFKGDSYIGTSYNDKKYIGTSYNDKRYIGTSYNDKRYSSAVTKTPAYDMDGPVSYKEYKRDYFNEEKSLNDEESIISGRSQFGEDNQYNINRDSTSNYTRDNQYNVINRDNTSFINRDNTSNLTRDNQYNVNDSKFSSTRDSTSTFTKDNSTKDNTSFFNKDILIEYEGALIKVNNKLITVNYLQGTTFVTSSGTFDKSQVQYIRPEKEDNVIIMEGPERGHGAIVLDIDRSDNCVIKILNKGIKNYNVKYLTKRSV